MKTTALIEKGADGKYCIFTPDINSTIIGEGDTVAEAKADFENSVKEVAEAYAEHGDPLPDELVDIEFEYRYDLASVFNYFDFINITAFARRIGINASLLRQYKSGLAPLSDAQKAKIEQGLHTIATELSALLL